MSDSLGSWKANSKEGSSATGLSMRRLPGLHWGVSETAAVSGDVSAALYLPFPGFPLYALQRSASQRDRTQDRLININFGADFSVWWELPPGFALDGDDHVRAVAQPEVSTASPRLELYGEIFIDDAQQSISNRTFIPDMVGGLIGIDLPALPGNLRLGANIEYVALTNLSTRIRTPTTITHTVAASWGTLWGLIRMPLF